jgi:nitrate reductase NapE component
MKKRSTNGRKNPTRRPSQASAAPRAGAKNGLAKSRAKRKRQEGKKEYAFLALCIQPAFGVISMAFFFALCWLFLHYGKAELAGPILANGICAAGGYGLGKWNARKSNQ